MYKDKDKQRDTDRKRARRYRASLKGVTLRPPKGVTTEGVTLPENYGLADCQCQHCLSNNANTHNHTINHGDYKSADELARNEFNRVSLPGDIDYNGSRAVGISYSSPGVELDGQEGR